MKYVMKWLLVFVLALSANAEVHRYDVARNPQQFQSYVELPAEIVGTLASNTERDRQILSFQVRAESLSVLSVPVAIYTYSGTGAVFKATMRMVGEGSYEQITGAERDFPLEYFSDGVEMMVEATQFRSGAQYVVRLGEFDPLTIAFDGNGGTPSTNEVTYLPGEPYGEFPGATRDGYDFTGWATAATNGVVLATNTTVCVGYTNLFAQWTQAAPTNTPSNVTTNHVLFFANGGEGNMATQTFIHGEAQALSSNQFTRGYYTFDGWATTATGKVVYADCAVVSNLSTRWTYVLLYAQWTRMPNVYDVVFNANGGSGKMNSQGFALNVSQALSTNQFTRAGYRFIGWGTEAKGSVVYTDGQIVTNLAKTDGAQVKLYAQWEKTDPYYVAYEANGGRGSMTNETFYVGKGQALSTNLYTRIGYQFTGWGVTNTGPVVYADAQVVTNLTTVSNGVVTLYAQWLFTPPPIYSNVINGVTWFFSATNGMATIQNVTTDRYCSAVKPLTVTRLSVPGSLMVGAVTNEVTAIGENAFEGLSSLTNIVIPASVDGVAGNAFSGCSNITSATLPMVDPLMSIMPDSYRKIRQVKVWGVGNTAFLDEEVTICEAAFSNCTSLVSVTLPLGVTELPASVFDGCSALASFEMPYTVTTIGARAFAGCTALTSITVTENVEEIGANAFTDCKNLKIVRYLGDEPDAMTGGAGNIYYHSNAALVSGFLQSMRYWPSAGSWSEGEGSSSSTNGTAVQTYTPAIWPDGGAGRPLLIWNNISYSFRKVTLDYNNGGKTPTTNVFYVAGRVLGELPESESDGFEGWFTKRYGGTEADPYTVVNSSMMLYAHWSGEGSGNGTRGMVDAFSPFYEREGSSFSYAAATFDGLLIDGDKVAGTVQIKTKKGKYVLSASGSNSTFTATMQVMGGKRTTLHGVIGPDGTAEVENEKKGISLSIELSQFGLAGSYSTEEGEYTIIAARDRFSAGSDSAKATVRVAVGHAGGNWNLILPTEDAEGDGAAFATGYSILSIAVGSRGKATVKGTMADGSKVSVSSKLVVGDSCCCLPVVVPLYSKKGGFSFALWFTWADDGSDSAVTLEGLTDWDATSSRTAPFEATFDKENAILAEANSSDALGEVSFQMENFFDIDGVTVEDSFSPDGTAIDASTSRWKLPKADAVRFVRDEGWTVVEGREYGNPAGLKLSYSSRTGTFSGSFRVFATTDEGRSKKYTATVTGAVVGDAGYGTATIRKVGSLPVKVE